MVVSEHTVKENPASFLVERIGLTAKPAASRLFRRDVRGRITAIASAVSDGFERCGK